MSIYDFTTLTLKLGKRAAKAGDTIEKRNQQYQLEYNKRKEAELAKQQ